MKSFDRSPTTPAEPYSMRLRSVCRQIGCNLGQYSDNGNSPRISPRQTSGQQLAKTLHHHHHHHHIGHPHEEFETSHSFSRVRTSSLKLNNREESFNQYRIASPKLKKDISSHLVVDSSDERTHRLMYDKRASSYVQNSSKRSYSDYSSGTDDSDAALKEKTDYTYAKSGSYSSRVTPSRQCRSPNMSRTRMTSSHLSNLSSSSSEGDFILFTKGLHSSHLWTNCQSSEHNASGSFQDSAKALKRNGGYSTVIKHSYGLDSEYSESEENVEARGHAESSGVLSTTTMYSSSFLQRFFFLRWLSTLNSWLWFNLWSSVYRIMCRILLLDTWLLSRSCYWSKRNKLSFVILPLFLPLLFLLANTLHISDNSSVATSLQNFPWSVMAYASAFFTSWSHRNASDAQHVRTSEEDGKRSIWSYAFSRTDGVGAFSSSQTRDASDIRDAVKSIFEEEFSGWMERIANEQKAFVRKQIEEVSQQSVDLKTLQVHLQHLSKELADLKMTNREFKVEKSNYILLHSKFERLEARLDDILLSLRNCCRNRTDYGELAALLLQATNGTGKPSGPFASFGDWVRDSLVNREELREHVAAMGDHISSDVSQRAEGVARRAAAAFLHGNVTTISSGTVLRDDGRTCPSRDDVENIVREAIYLYDADKTGLVDYALESSGGSVISTRCAETYQTGTAQFRLFGIPFWYTSNSPRTVIQPGVHPGQCWAFRGTHGYLVIELSATIKPTAFSVEHIPKSLSPTGSIDSAPKEFSVTGLKKESDLEGVLLGRYIFDADGEPLQYFAVEETNVDFYPIMELRIHSNYGNQDYTCLYRFRVHGTRQ